MQSRDKMIDLAPRGHAALSQNVVKQDEDLLASDSASFTQAA